MIIVEEGVRGEKGGTGGARERPQNDRRDAKGSTLDGGTAKATAADLQREKTPRNGRARLDHWACFRPQNVVFVNPPKDSPEYWKGQAPGSRLASDQKIKYL